MRLNIGCGHAHWPGFVNVDSHDDKKMGPPDVRAEAGKLPYDKGQIDEIHAIHIFEHFSRMDADDILREWHRVLKTGGKLVMEMPCLDKIAQLIVNKEKNARLTVLGLYGDPRYKRPEMEHKWAYGEGELTEMLDAAGFNGVSFLPPKFHFPERDFRVEAVKP